MSIKLKEIPTRVFLKYGLLMIPGTVVLILILIMIRPWVSLPIWLVGIIVLLWLAKEVIMFPFVWRAYDDKWSGASRPMIGEHGIARERMMPTGYIQIGGELWLAEKIDDGPAIEKGELVRIEKIEGLKLFVVSEAQRADDERQMTADRWQQTDDNG